MLPDAWSTSVYFKEPIKHSRWYSRHQEAFIKGEHFFHQYGIYSVALGRFIGPIRAVIPTIAGSMGMSGKVFFIVNVFSALIWAPAYILPGILVGETLGDIYTYLEQYIEIKIGSLILLSLSILIALSVIKRSKHGKKSIAYIGIILLSAFSLALTQTKLPW